MDSNKFIIAEFHDGLQLIPAAWYNADKLCSIYKYSKTVYSNLLLTPKLKADDIKCNTFNKMKVNKAKHVFSHDVSCSFNLLSDENNRILHYSMICKTYF